MRNLLNYVAKLIDHVAIIGGGLPSAGFSYQPPKPEQLTSRIQQHSPSTPNPSKSTRKKDSIIK